MDITPMALAADACWLPHRLLDRGATIRFVRADRKAQQDATFLDDEHLGPQATRADAATSAIGGARAADPASLHFVFHSAFCCSTLLARAFDLPGFAMGLKEPIILNDAVQLSRAGLLTDGLLDLVLRLLARPYGSDKTVIVKPSNAANRLMTDILRLRPDARAILMYRPLPAYLRSVAAKGMFGRIWARRLLTEIRNEMSFSTGFSDIDYLQHTDLQAAALGWLVQHGQFAHLAAIMPERVRSLSATELLADKRAALAASSNWFGLDMEADVIRSIADGPVFAEDAKKLGRRFYAQAEQQPSADEKEIAMVTSWINAVAAHVDLQLDFGPHLLRA